MSLDSILQNIDFDKLIQVFSMNRFRPIFPKYKPPFGELRAETKKEFISYCLRENVKEFIGLLLHSGQYEAANIIEPTTIDITDTSKLDPNKGNITTNCPYVELNPKLDRLVQSNEHKLDSMQYNMSKSPRGICLIINNYLTYGTFKETQRLRNIFYQFHFDVILEINLTAKQIKEKLVELSGDKALQTHEAFACLIISHGTEKAEIIGFDGTTLEIRDLCQLFDNDNCPQLRGKPRAFIFNCCRGKLDYDYNYYSNLALNDTIRQEPLATPVKANLPQLPKILDFLICYSTLDGCAAYVDWNKGTLFGTTLCESLINRGWIRDMNAILIRTNNLLQNIQPFNWEVSNTHYLNFNPAKPFERKFM